MSVTTSPCDHHDTGGRRAAGAAFDPRVSACALAGGEEQPAASLNPTAALAGLLYKHGKRHHWLESATRFCWGAIAASETTEYHVVMPVLAFLEHVPGRERAERELGRVAERIHRASVVTYEMDVEGYVKGPL